MKLFFSIYSSLFQTRVCIYMYVHAVYSTYLRFSAEAVHMYIQTMEITIGDNNKKVLRITTRENFQRIYV
jgi:hypothetical protein